MTARHLRALRGVASAWIATIVAATAHTLAGGGAPSPAIVAGVATLAAPLAVALVGRRLAAWRVTATVLGSQLLFHAAFAITAGANPSASAGAHEHHTYALVDAGHGLVATDPMMTAAHVLAAIATVWGLHAGERMLRALGRGIRSMLSRADVVLPHPAVPLLVAATATARPRAARIVLAGLSRRGPPAPAFA